MQEKSHVCDYDHLTMVALLNEKLLCTVGHLPQKHKRYFTGLTQRVNNFLSRQKQFRMHPREVFFR